VSPDVVHILGRPAHTFASTYLPVRDVVTVGSHGTIQDDFQWLRPTPANLAELDVPIPAGFTQVRPPAPAGPPAKQH
jgi:hypothetical protein